MTATPRQLTCIGLSHHEASVEVREKFALQSGQACDAAGWLTAEGCAGGAVVLSTCNRTEIYATLPPARDAASVIAPLYAKLGRDLAPGDLDQIVVRRGRQVAEHLFGVVSGTDSMVVGETEIFGQVKQAYESACQSARADKILHRLFQAAFRAGKAVRSRTAITRGSVSVASTAVELAEKIFGALHECRVVVLGAGDTGEKAARALISRGVRTMIVANRTYEHAKELAAALGAGAARYDALEEEFLKADILISSTSAPGYVLEADRFAPLTHGRGDRPLLLVDLAVPRDIDPALAKRDGVYLFNIDDLQGIAESHQQERKRALEQAAEILGGSVADFVAWLDAEYQRGTPAGQGSLQPGPAA